MADADASPEEVRLLAELDAGLLDGAGRERAEALADTQRGRAALAALGRVRADLAALPAPELPAEFGARLRAVLEQPVPPPVAAARPHAAPPLRRSRWSRSAPWLVGAAAAALALGTSVGTGVLRPATSDSQAVSAGGAGESTGSSGALAEGPGRAADGGGSAGTGPPADPPEAAAVAGAPVVTAASGRDYGREDLPGAALDLAGRVGLAPGRPPVGAPADLARLTDPVALQSCLVGLGAGLAETPLVDFARFEGRPALVVLVADVARDAVTAYVVGPSCSAADPDLRHVGRA